MRTIKVVNKILTLCEDIVALGMPRPAQPPWYMEIEPHYDHLNTLIQYEPTLAPAVMSQPRFERIENDLHRIRAAYENDRELDTGRFTLQGHDWGHLNSYQEMLKIMEEDAHWAFNHEMEIALLGKKNVLVAGSGPLPVTGFSIVRAMGINVTCVNIDASAHFVSNELTRMSPFDTITNICSDVGEMENLEQYDAIVTAVLLGVDQNKKPDVMNHLIDKMGSGCTLVIREALGYGRLFYPQCYEQYNLEGLEVSSSTPRLGRDHPYRSSLIVASKP